MASAGAAAPLQPGSTADTALSGAEQTGAESQSYERNGPDPESHSFGGGGSPVR